MGGDSLLHLALPSPRLPRRARHAYRSIAVCVIAHLMVAVLVTRVGVSRPTASMRAAADSPAKLDVTHIVFLQPSGPGGGGGGGGNRQTTPPSRAQSVGKDRAALPVPHPVAQATPADSLPPLQQVVIDAVPMMSGTEYKPGLVDANPFAPFSHGPGSGGGFGQGSGTGMGAGSGQGLGRGTGGGFGGGAYRPGNGVTAPTLLKQVTPLYTPEAMQHHLQGTVILEAVIGPDGIPSAIRVVRSLGDGLDEAAVHAAEQWRFNPGRAGETPVAVLVRIMLDFRIR